MRRIVIIMAAAIAAVLTGAGTAMAAGAPQTPQSATFEVSCPGIAPFLASSPTPPSAAGVGTPMAVIPQGIFRGPMPADLVMTCTLTDVSTGEIITNVPILIAPTTH
jgi:hypothetical protein